LLIGNVVGSVLSQHQLSNYGSSIEVVFVFMMTMPELIP